MSHISVILWTLSLLLALTGVIFGIVASVNSTKANLKIKNVITATFAAEESQKLFFDHVQSVMAKNRVVAKQIKEKTPMTYLSYATLSYKSRLTPLSANLLNIIKQTELKGVGLLYKKIKRELDGMWFKIVTNTSILTDDKEIPNDIRKQLIAYHLTASKTCSVILENYSRIIEANNEKFTDY